MSDLRFEYRIQGLERVLRLGGRFEQAYQEAGREQMIQATAVLSRAIVLKFQKPASRLPPAINTGLLRNSVAWRIPRIEGRTIEGGVGTHVAYALPVEFGSRPHWPPLAPIELWVKRKLRPQVLAVSIRTRRPSRTLRGEAAQAAIRRTAFLVARKIARRGTQPRRVFTLGLEEARPKMTEIFDRLPVAIVRKLRE